APFGGKLIVLGGDFRQVLPVILRAGPAEVVAACVNRASFWPRVKILRLRQNMRVSRLEREGEDASPLRAWAQFLERISDGTEPAIAMGGLEDCVRLPDAVCLPPESRTMRGLVDSIFGEARWGDTVWMTGRAVLAARNEEVDRVNDDVFARFPAEGPDVELLSADSTEEEGEEAVYPVEFLNSINPSGLPPHKLRLKKNMPVMLLRNLASAKEVANGTRLIVKGVLRHVIDAEIANRSHVGRRVFIPRITLTPSEDGFRMPFKLKRRQFPVRLAFAMTINKAQGQTLQRVGLFLPSHVFPHGQLYVALSRVGSE
ncbi:MAG: DEAD/DEAH box helicase, partial [Acidimicrobiales bacterium]